MAFLRQNNGKFHPWIVLTHPVPKKGKVVCVNLTSLGEHCVDDKCILSKSDYDWIEENHPTVVAYSYAQLFDVEKLEMVIKDGKLRLAHPPNVPAKTLETIRAFAKEALDPQLRRLL